MDTITYQTIYRKIDLCFDSIAGVLVKVDGETVAQYNAELVWDYILELFKELHPGDNPGLQRRHDEAIAVLEYRRTQYGVGG